MKCAMALLMINASVLISATGTLPNGWQFCGDCAEMAVTVQFRPASQQMI
jgi:hypothetical protein